MNGQKYILFLCNAELFQRALIMLIFKRALLFQIDIFLQIVNASILGFGSLEGSEVRTSPAATSGA